MPNTLVTPTWVTNETALRFMNSVKGVANFNRTYDDKYRQAGAKVGATVSARLPWRPTVRSGQTYNANAITDSTVPITLSYQRGVDFDWTSVQATLEIDRIKERYTNPAADALAADADAQGMLDVYTSVYNSVGTPGTTPTTKLSYLQAGAKIFDLAGPEENLVAILDVMASINIADTVSGLFHPGGKISDAVEKGRFDRKILGIDEWHRDQQVPTHTTGTFTSSTPLVNGASQTGSSIITDGWASGASSLKKGDIFTMAGVNSVNPTTRKSTGRLQQFVVTADISDSTGAMTINISPSIVTSGQLQTVSGSPADNAAINVWAGSGTYALSTTVSPQSLVFHADFAAFVMADLVEPNGGAKATFARSRDWGVSLRFVQQYGAQEDINRNRMDILFGAAPLQPRLACRVVG